MAADELSLGNIIASAERVHGKGTPQAALAAAQAIHESGLTRGDGGSRLARDHNNLFGIKGSGTAGTANMRTGENFGGQNVTITAGFASNRTVEDSFRQHKTLMEKPRYAMVGEAETFQQAAQAVKSAGYATDPAYVAKLNSTYEQYVKPVMGEVTAAATDLTRTPEAAIAGVVSDLRAGDPNSEAAGRIDQLAKDGKLIDAQNEAHREGIRVLKASGVTPNAIDMVVASRFGANSAAAILKADPSATLASLAKDGKGGLTKESLDGFLKEAKGSGVAVPEGKTLENTTAGELKKFALDHGSKVMAKKFPQVAAGKRGSRGQRDAEAEGDFGSVLQGMMMNGDGSANIGMLLLVLLAGMLFGDKIGDLFGSKGQGAAPPQQASTPVTPEEDKAETARKQAVMAAHKSGSFEVADMSDGSNVSALAGKAVVASAAPVIAR